MIADRDIFEEIQLSLRKGHAVRLTSKSPGVVIGEIDTLRTTQTSHRIQKEEQARIKAGHPIGIIRRRLPVLLADWAAIKKVDSARRRRGEIEKVIWVPHWDRTGHMLKGLAWSMSVWEAGGSVLTVNIADSVIEAAERDRRGFASHMRERLQRELRATSQRIGCNTPEFFFVVEASELGTPHLHGGITLPPDGVSRSAIRMALFEAAYGKGASLKRTGREIDLQDFRTPAKWANYAAKWWRGSADRLDGRVFAATSGVRAIGKAWYERMRRTEALIGGHEPEDDDPLGLYGPS
ncbi:MAG: hypothetical protein Q8J89_09515 [Caulobacter sp.]|nr:hypothetical protein [Caulobacter sp.]